MKNIKLIIQYDGTGFHGWQAQPGTRTVEQELTKAVMQAVGHSITLYGSGRTDRGVHAFGQVANFRTDTTIDLGNLPRVINYHAPEDLAVVKAEEVPADFHSRFSAKGKWYRYLIYNDRIMNPVYRHRAALIHQPLDEQKMRRALEPLLGVHDFLAFMGPRAMVHHSVREVEAIEVRRQGKFIVVDIKGKSFLKYMVRIMVGTAIEVGYGKRGEDVLRLALEAKDRKLAGKTAPAHGLTLMEVYYERFERR